VAHFLFTSVNADGLVKRQLNELALLSCGMSRQI